MRPPAVAILSLLFFLLATAPAHTGGIGISLSYGGWTLTPFTPLVEKESEAMIRSEFSNLMDPILPPYILFDNRIDADFSDSSGHFLSCRLWMDISSKFSLGIQGDLIHFRMPYRLYAEQEFTFDQFVLARQTTEGNGSLVIKSAILSLSLGFKLIRLKNLDIFLTGGVSVMPFEGEFELTGQVTYTTIVGSLTFEEEERTDIDQLRTMVSDIPSVIIAPTAGVTFYYRLFNSGGITLSTNLSHGFSGTLGGYIRL
jgi:hypothetical protein